MSTMSQPTLCISRWSETFENADTRKRERLKFFHAPSGCDSNGYLELMTCHQSAGVLAFGIFQALCQHTATMPAKNRGKFLKSNGSAMNITQIALLIRVEPATLSEAVEILTSKEIGWLHWDEEKSESADNLPTICHQSPAISADNLPPTAGFVQGQGKGKGEGQGQVSPISPQGGRGGEAVAINEFSDLMPTATANDMDRLVDRINSLHPSWKKRPKFSAIEFQSLMANSSAWLDVTDADWNLAQAFMFAAIPDDWKKGPGDMFQPDNRKALIGMGPTSLLTYADRWRQTAKAHGKPIKIASVA